MTKRKSHAGARPAGGTPAHGVDDDHERARGTGDGRIHVGWRAELADAETGQIRAHRGDEHFWIGHAVILQGFPVPERAAGLKRPLATRNMAAVPSSIGRSVTWSSVSPLASLSH